MQSEKFYNYTTFLWKLFWSSITLCIQSMDVHVYQTVYKSSLVYVSSILQEMGKDAIEAYYVRTGPYLKS